MVDFERKLILLEEWHARKQEIGCKCQHTDPMFCWVESRGGSFDHYDNEPCRCVCACHKSRVPLVAAIPPYTKGKN